MSEHDFEPEVVALLDEIARSPEGSLLRIPKGRLLRFAGRPQETLSPYGSHLSKAEKHLVTAYREQAARVLLEACILKQKEELLTESTLAPSPEQLYPRALAVFERLPPGDPSARALHALGNEIAVSCAGLAIASIRLAPSELGLNCLALAYQQEGHIQTSVRVLRGLLTDATSFNQRAQAYSNLARAFEMRQMFRHSLDCNLKASATDERLIDFLVWSVTSAIQAGDEKNAIEAARRMDGHPRSCDIARLTEGLHRRKEKGLWSPSRVARRASSHVRKHASERSAIVCEAFS